MINHGNLLMEKLIIPSCIVLYFREQDKVFLKTHWAVTPPGRCFIWIKHLIYFIETTFKNPYGTRLRALTSPTNQIKSPRGFAALAMPPDSDCLDEVVSQAKVTHKEIYPLCHKGSWSAGIFKQVKVSFLTTESNYWNSIKSWFLKQLRVLSFLPIYLSMLFFP